MSRQGVSRQVRASRGSRLMPQPLDELRKLGSRLRCVANGDTGVNTIRAERSGAIQVEPSVTGSRDTLARAAFSPEQSIKSRPHSKEMRALKRGKQTTLSDDVKVNVFVLFDR